MDRRGNRPPRHVATVTALRDAAVISYRWWRTFSRLRERSRLAGALSFPLSWAVNMVLIGTHAGDIAHYGAAAMRAPNPRRVAPRRLLLRVLVVDAVLVVGGISLVLGVAALAGTAIYILALALICCCCVATLADGLLMVYTQRAAGNLKQSEALLRPAIHGPLVIGTMFGAWPRKTGAGGHLLSQVLKEQHSDRVTMLVQARDEQAARWYVDMHGGTRVNPDHPLHVAWLAIDRRGEP